MLQEIDSLVAGMSSACGRDLSSYDPVFLAKSLDNRLAAAGIPTLADYLRALVADPSEADAFVASLSVSHSEFFRSPLSFALLEQQLLPMLMSEKEAQGRAELRIWSAGCAAGQEACSLAILLLDLQESRKHPLACRIFATDNSEAALAEARRGSYTALDVQNVRLRHLERYFAKNDETYAVLPAVKALVDFSAYDLLEQESSCPSASIYGDFDVVCCCNVLFYYRPEVRRLILGKLWRALAPGGYLLTGDMEKEMVRSVAGFEPARLPAAVFKRI